MLNNDYIRVVVANENTGRFTTGIVRPNPNDFVELFESTDLEGKYMQIGKYQYFVIFDVKRQKAQYPITAMTKTRGIFNRRYKTTLRGSFVIAKTNDAGRPVTLSDDEINNVMKHLILISDTQRTNTFPVVEVAGAVD